jgi:hypothetical protein
LIPLPWLLQIEPALKPESRLFHFTLIIHSLQYVANQKCNLPGQFCAGLFRQPAHVYGILYFAAHAPGIPDTRVEN